MTTLNEAKEAVYERFVANYTGVTTDRIGFDNEEFEEPDTGDWVRLVVRNTIRTQDTLGKKTNRKFRGLASIFVQVYTPFNTGVQQSDALAREAKDVFEGESFSGLNCFAGVIQETGPDGRWYQTVVEIPFDYFETK